MSALLDVCRFVPTAGGTTDWTYSSAVTGYQSPTAAGAVNGLTYSYRAESADLTQWEVGTGVYNSTGAGSFARTAVLFNSSGTTSKISFAAAPQVAIVALAEDLTVTRAATQAEMEATTATDAALTPANAKYHPGVAKAWVVFDGKTGGVATIKASHGVSTVTRNATGDYSIAFAASFSSSNYAFVAFFSDPGVALQGPMFIANSSQISTAGLRFETRSFANVDADMSIVNVIFYGDW